MNTAIHCKLKAARIAALLLICAFISACQSSDLIVEKKENGDTLEYTYKDGKARGIWQTYDSQNGLARKTVFYSKNKKLLEIRYYPDGQPKSLETISPDGKSTKINYNLDGLPMAKAAIESESDSAHGYTLHNATINLKDLIKLENESAKLNCEIQSKRNGFEATIFILPLKQDGSIFGKIHLKGKLNRESGKLEDFSSKVYYGDWKVVGGTIYDKDDNGVLNLDLLHIGKGKCRVLLSRSNLKSELIRVLKSAEENGANCVVCLPSMPISRIKKSE